MSQNGTLFGNLALWLWLRGIRTPSPVPKAFPNPSGDGPLLLIHLPSDEEDPSALTPLVAALLSGHKNLRIAFSGGKRQPSDDAAPNIGRSVNLPRLNAPAVAAAALAQLKPAAILILGSELPAALIVAAHEARLAIILAEARIEPHQNQGVWRGLVNRSLLARITKILSPDQQAFDCARKMGVTPARIEMIGPVTDTRAPLRGNEAERQALAQQLRGRHIWLASAPTLPEAEAALAAHHDALQYNHRALLIIAGLAPDVLPQVQRAGEELGMAMILRTDDDDPQPDDQVLIAEDDDEMGLWYRLAPVCFMGGTLIEGAGLTPRHPFEPASLGSAIIHGPLPAGYEAEWAQLDGASAARKIADAAGLKQAVADLSLSEQAALLARNAWTVSTGGAAVVRRIVSEILTAMEPKS